MLARVIYKNKILNGDTMKFKQIFCRHNWLWIGNRNITDSKGNIIKTYYKVKCEKCGIQLETLNDEFKLKAKVKKDF
jgi:hypothetical protein